MKSAANKTKRLVMSARILLGGVLMSSLVACSSGGSDSSEPSDPSGSSGGKSSSTSSTSSSSTSGGDSSSSGSSSSSGGSSSGGGAIVLEEVVWTELINTSVDGDTLKKTGGCDGCLDAGAESKQFTPAGNGYLEFTVNDTSKIRYIGFNANSTTTRPTELFGLKLVSGYAEVKEEGQYRADVPVSVGDVLRIAVKSGMLTYAKNGTVFYTSAVTLNLPLQVDTALISMGGTFKGVKMTVAADSAGGSVSPSASSSSNNVTWTDLVNVTASGDSLQKTGGCDGCEDAGAVSGQQLASGGGYLDFTVAETGPELYVGLNDDNTGTSGVDIAFAIKLVNDSAEVREHGQYRARIAVGSGDTLRITVQAGVVSYAKNGGMFYISDTRAGYPLRVDTAFISSGSTLSNVRITGGGGK